MGAAAGLSSGPWLASPGNDAGAPLLGRVK